MPKDPGNDSDADTSVNILQFQRRQDVGRPEQLQNGGFFTVRQDHRADICSGRNSKEQHSKSSFSSNTPRADERLFSSQKLNVLHGSIKDSRHGPPHPTVRNSLCESRHSNWGSNVAAHCDSPSSWFTAVALSWPWKPLNEMKSGFLHLIDSLPLLLQTCRIRSATLRYAAGLPLARKTITC